MDENCLPVIIGQKGVGARQRGDSTNERVLERFDTRRTPRGRTHDGLHGRQRVFHTVMKLPDQKSLFVLLPLAIRDVHQHVHRPNQRA